MLKHLLIYEDDLLKNALSKIDKSGLKSLVVINNDRKLVGTITDGDIRKHFIRSSNKKKGIKNIFNQRPKYIYIYDINLEKINKTFRQYRINILPLVDKNKNFVNCFIKGFSEHNNKIYEKYGKSVLIMAGGMGVRLKPFTDVLPKPLIPINGKPIIQLILDLYS